MVGLEVANHRSFATQFDENSYPVMLTAWYAPTPRWSVSGALAFFSSWLDQEITIGNGHRITNSAPPGQPLVREAHDTLMADYTGRSDVVTLASDYALTERLTLNGDFQFSRGQNTWAIPSPAGTSLSNITQYSAVIIETTRFGAGVDYELGCNTSCFFKYMFYDYNDKAGDLLSGSYHMILGGLAAKF
ncbi:MAG: hypothetical protein ACYC6Y_25365, partial [Thermoguttaceae bacterium]